MVSIIGDLVEWGWLAIHIQIGQVVFRTGRALSVVASAWVRQLGCGLSRKQKSVALSSAEAEYMAASQASCEALWLHKLMVDLFDMELSPIVIQCDNQSCIKLSENPVFHDRSKHIEIRYPIHQGLCSKRGCSFVVCSDR